MNVRDAISAIVTLVTTDLRALKLLVASAIASAAAAMQAAMRTDTIKFYHSALNGPWGVFAFLVTDRVGRIAFGIRETGTVMVESLAAHMVSGPAFRDLRISPYRSSTSLPVQTGTVIVRTRAFLAIAPGERRRLVSRSSLAWIEGQVLEYEGGDFLLAVDQVGPVTGTYSDWTIVPGTAGRALMFDGTPDAAAGAPGMLAWRRDTGQLLVFDGTWQAATSGPALDAGAVYVSSVNANGIKAGDNATGGIGPDRPYATVAVAQAAHPGVRLRLNGSPTAPPLYDAPSLATDLDIAPVLPGGARLPALSLPAGSTATSIQIGGLAVDVQGGANALTLGSTAGLVTMTLSGTRLINFTGTGVIESGAATRVLLRPRDISINVNGARAAIEMVNMVAGGVDGIRGRMRISGHTDTTGGIVRLKAKAVGVTSKWVQGYGRIDIAAGLTGGDLHYTTQILNIAGEETIACRWEIHSPAGSPRNGCAFHISADLAAPLSAENWRSWLDTHINGVAGGAYCFKENEEGANTAAATRTNGGQSYRSRHLGTDISFAQSAALHGLYSGGRSNSRHIFPLIKRTGYALALKVTDGALVEFPIIVDASKTSITVKGTKNTTIRRWTAVQKDAAGDGELIQASAYISAGETSENCLNTVIEGGIGSCSFLGLSTIQIDCLADGTGAQPVTLRDNNYHLPVGVAANRLAWGYTGSNAVLHSRISSWIADKEPTAKASDPKFADVDAGDFRPTENSLAIGLATVAPTSATSDYYGNDIVTPGPAGAAGVI